MTLKVRFSDFRIITRSRSFIEPVAQAGDLEIAAVSLLDSIPPDTKGVRLLGVILSSLENATVKTVDQLDLPLWRDERRPMIGKTEDPAGAA